MRLRKLLAAAVLTAMAAAVTGCGSKAEDTENKNEGASWDMKSNISVVSREGGSGTRGAFIELLGVEEKDKDGEEMNNITEEAGITISTSVMISTIAGNEYAIGYISLGSLDDRVKAVKVDGAEATADNIKSGMYEITRTFNIVTKESVSEDVQDFINFIMSSEGQRIIAENNYIPVEDVQRYEPNGAAGKIIVAGSSSVSSLMEKLKDAYMSVNKRVEIEIQISDSKAGITAALDGRCDIGMVSRELEDMEKEEGLVATAIALDGIAVIVNNASTVEDMTSDQIRAVFTGDALSWKEALK